MNVMNFLKKTEQYFEFRERNTGWNFELIGGVTTFLTMSYIIFLQPVMLSGALFEQPTGMDQMALFTSVCLASALGSFFMGLIAKYPVALAPGMGANVLFVLTLLPICAKQLKLPLNDPQVWRLGLAVIFCSGLIFFVISFMNIRNMMAKAISMNLKYAIAGGIGLFIALIGLEKGGIIVIRDSSHLGLSQNLCSVDSLVFFVGLLAITVYHILRMKGAILLGICTSLLVALVFGKLQFTGVCSLPPSPAPVFMQFDLAALWKHFSALLPLIIIFTMIDIFDTLGTLIGTAAQGGFLTKEGELPDANKAFGADAAATLTGALLGQSTVTSYIESAGGIEAGAKTGVSAITAGFCFIIAMFFGPLISAISGYPQVLAPALVIVGLMMMRSIKLIDWEDYSEAVPSFIIFTGIAFCYSIADGMAMGLIAYPLIKLFTGRWREASMFSYFMAVLLLGYLLFIR